MVLTRLCREIVADYRPNISVGKGRVSYTLAPYYSNVCTDSLSIVPRIDLYRLAYLQLRLVWP